MNTTILFLVVASFLTIILIDLPKIMQSNKKLKTATVYFSILILGFIISIFLIVHKPFLTPTKVINVIVNKILSRG